MDTKTLLAALSAAHVGGSDGLIKIVPKGQFAPVDGRTDTGVPHWTMSADLAQQIIAAFDAAQTDLVVDYEHATLKAAETGQQNPAAGWISKKPTGEFSIRISRIVPLLTILACCEDH